MLRNKLTIFMTSIVLLTAVLALPLTIFAQAVSPTQRADQSMRLATVHANCDNQISQRLTSLNNVATRINGLIKLSADQKNQFNGQITTDINGLTSLKAKCDADTDLVTLRADYQSIFTTYRVYAEFLPQLHLLVASDTMDVTENKLSDLATKLQIRIQNAGNPANLTSLLSDMQNKASDANTQYSNVQSQVTSLTPQSYDSNPTGTTATLQTARGEIKTGAQDLQSAWSDAKQIYQVLKAMPSTNPSPTTAQ